MTPHIGGSFPSDAAARLSDTGAVKIEPGLSGDEIDRVETTYGFEFADDHRAFLTAGLPTGQGWPNWRAVGSRALSTQLRLPVDGVLFAVEWKQFWDEVWGRRPARMKDALRSAAYQLDRVPTMVPVYATCYLPASGPSRHPVLSIYQDAVVVAGADLLDYVDRQFGSGRPGSPQASAPTVEFWSAHVR